jgi:tRNA A-37 threonylcarbamoyl transferase component Bud32
LSESELEQALRDLPKFGTLVKDRGYRQIWRFEFGGKAYFLKFYPIGGLRYAARRIFRGSPAMREFVRLQWLQKAQIPAPRVVAVMMGFHINGVKGDAVILSAIEPSVQLDQYLADLQQRGEPIPNHTSLSRQVRQLVHQLGRAEMGHEDLHLGNFILSNGQLSLLDGYAVRRMGLKMSDVLQLGHSVDTFATRTDLLRGWQVLGPGAKLPRVNPLSKKLYGRFLQRIYSENRYFGEVSVDGWSGVYFKQTKFPKRWSTVSRLQFTARDWESAWPQLLAKMDSDTLNIIKRSRSGDVLSGEVVLNGRPIGVVIKRPRRRYWYRYLNEIGRGARARRAWRKAWECIVRDMPTAWPLIFMERRVAGYVVDTAIVFEQVPGPTLGSVNLDEMSPADRDTLFRRTGRLLRRIESFGFAHFDAKSTNWIVRQDDMTGPQPVLIDVDGIRFRRWRQLGIRRLLRSMKDRPQFSEADSLALRQGYAPYSPKIIEDLSG